jgi:TonB-linked SusC/RagA family outer membrane protein
MKKCFTRFIRGGIILLAFCFSAQSFGKAIVDITVTGTVTDAETGEPIPGVSIVVRGTNQGTATDAQGKYALTVPEDAVLVFSSIGYQSQEIAVDNRSTIDVALQADIQTLEDVVVIGYGTEKRSRIMGSIGSVSGESIQQSKGIVSPEQAIQGRVAGVNVTSTSGIPGQGLRVDIRGAASVSGSNEPLYVIDGVPMSSGTESRFEFGIPPESPIAHLNPSDIESIEVLKDASAAAIYGSRATNGVVLITTKRGSEGPTQFNFSAGVGIENVRKKIDIASSDDYLEVMNEARANYNADRGLSPGDAGYRPPLVDPREPGQQDTDWFDLVTQHNAMVENYNLSVSGGNAKTRFFISGEYMNHEGIIHTNGIDRISGRMNLDHKASDRLDLKVSIGLSRTENNRIQNEDSGRGILVRSLEQRPYDKPFKEDGSYTVGGVDILRHNGVQVINEQDVSLINHDAVFETSATLKILEGLRFQSKVGGEYRSSHEYVYLNANHPRGGAGGVVHDWRSTRTNILFENTLTFDHDFTDKLHFGGLLGHSLQKFVYEPSYVSGEDFPSPSFGYIESAGRITGGWTSWTAYALESYISRFNLNYDEKYIVWFSLRRDGSSKFLGDNRYGWFPSVSAGWRLGEEQFVRDLGIFSDLRLRVSYGVTGNQDGIGDFAAVPSASGGENYRGATGIAIVNVGNPDLTWETANQLNIGLDAGFFNGRLSFTADYFIQKTNDLLYNRPIQTTSGFSSTVQNIGSMENRGVELSIHSVNTEGRVSWTTDFNISSVRNELTSLIGEAIPVGEHHVIREGEPLGSFYILRQLGIYQNNDDVPQPQFNQGVRAGDIIYEDVNGDNIITSADRQVIGSPNPDFYGGINNTLRFGNFDLSAFISFKYGNEIYNNWARRLDSFGTYEYALRADNIDKRWTGPGTSNTVPRAILGNYNIQNSTRFLEDGSYLRLQNVTFGYTLPESIVEKIKARSLRLSVSARNLFTITNYSGMDPEVSATLSPTQLGVDHFSVPQMRSFIFNLELGF